jgi:pimeloyl-ACP methyl ester carboxylesterase
MKKYYIETKDMKVGITEWGCKNNETIVCIHGLGGSSLSFIEIGEKLQDKYHFLSIDLPGHGRTTIPSNKAGYEMPNLVEWLNEVISLLACKNFNLLAHSWGGDIALHYAATYPLKVNKILLIDGGYYVKPMLYEYMNNSLENELAFYEKDFDNYVFSTWGDCVKEEEKAYLRYSNSLKNASMDLMREDSGMIKFIASGAVAKAAIIGMYNSPTSIAFNKLSDNILLLQSTLPESWLSARNFLTDFFNKNTKAVVKQIPNVTHMLHWDNPDVVVEELINWFN